MTAALYRRYRSERFADLVGQDVIARTLLNEIRAGSLAHAYLFAGVRGTGKTSTARILARAVNCLAPQDGEPCNSCAHCREILAGASVDVLEIDAASNRGIDEMRDLRDKVKYLPAALRRKVYIIDEAHMLTTEAWNAFLKTLEEPPDHVLFVLATTEPHKIPDTVRSRVQRFDFRRISTTDIAAHLRDIAAQEEVAVEAAATDLIARSAQGSMRDALSLLDQAVSGGERPVTLAVARRALGLTDPATLHALVRALSGADAAGALRAAARAFEAGADPRQLLRDVARLARAAELTALGYPEGSEVGAEEAALAADVAAVAPAGFWLRALDLFAEAEMNLRQPVDARLQVELCLLRLVRPSPAAADDDALAAIDARLTALERSAARPPAAPALAVSPAGAPAAATEPEQPAREAAPVREPAAGLGHTSVDDWRADWQVLIDAVTRMDAMLAGVLRDCRPVEAGPDRLVVGAGGNFHYERLREPAKATVLSDAVAHVAGRPLVVEARFIGEAPAAPAPPPGTIGDATQAVLQTFAGSRVTATRTHERDPGAAPASPRGA